MDVIFSKTADAGKTNPPNGPRDLLSRLYREIGISAVAAALQLPEEALATTPTAVEKRAALLAAKAA